MCHKNVKLGDSQNQLNSMVDEITPRSNKSSAQQLKQRDVGLSQADGNTAEFCSRAHAVLANLQTVAKSIENTNNCHKSPKKSESTKRPKTPKKTKPKTTVVGPEPEKTTPSQGMTQKQKSEKIRVKSTTIGLY